MHSENSIFNIIEKKTFLRSARSYSHYVLPFIYLVDFKVLCLKTCISSAHFFGIFLVFLRSCPIALALTMFSGLYLPKGTI